MGWFPSTVNRHIIKYLIISTSRDIKHPVEVLRLLVENHFVDTHIVQSALTVDQMTRSQMLRSKIVSAKSFSTKRNGPRGDVTKP